MPVILWFKWSSLLRRRIRRVIRTLGLGWLDGEFTTLPAAIRSPMIRRFRPRIYELPGACSEPSARPERLGPVPRVCPGSTQVRVRFARPVHRQNELIAFVMNDRRVQSIGFRNAKLDARRRADARHLDVQVMREPLFPLPNKKMRVTGAPGRMRRRHARTTVRGLNLFVAHHGDLRKKSVSACGRRAVRGDGRRSLRSPSQRYTTHPPTRDTRMLLQVQQAAQPSRAEWCCQNRGACRPTR